MTAKQRPLSPHLGIYKPQISSVMSILHRMTGVGISLGLLLLVAWLVFMAGGKDSYALFVNNIGSVLGQLALFILCFLIFSAILCFGFRHIWKSGFSSQAVKIISCLLMIVIALALTVAARQFAAGVYTASFDSACDVVGEIVLIGVTWAFFYHFWCGIRHLLWDAGWFLSLRGMHVTGWLVILLSTVSALMIWLKIWGVVS